MSISVQTRAGAGRDLETNINNFYIDQHDIIVTICENKIQTPMIKIVRLQEFIVEDFRKIG